MTPIHWLNDVSGSFTNPAHWSGGVIPRSGDDAILDPAGVTPFTVSLTSNAEVNSIQTAADATLAITGKLFRAVNGTGSGVNAGTITVGDNSAFRADGLFDNTGKVALSRLMTAGAGSLTLTGGGSIVEYAQQVRSMPHGRLTGANLTNVDNTITGGQLNSEVGLDIECTGVLTNEVRGVLANRTARAYVNQAEIDAGTIFNSGKIENTGGNLHISASYIDNSGTITNALGQQMELSCNKLVNTGEIKLGMNFERVGVYAATFVNAGQISNPGPSLLEISTLTGSAIFSNDGYIISSGRGIIDIGGFGSDAIANTGTILASGGYVFIGAVFAQTPTVANSGLLEATAGGYLLVGEPLVNTGQVEVTGGTIVFEVAVTGSGAITIAGGRLEFGSATAANVEFTQPSGRLDLVHSIGFAGTVSGFSTTSGTSLDLWDIGFTGSAEASFSGNSSGGILTVSDGSDTAHIQLAGDYLSANFATSNDGRGGVLVTASSGAAHAFVAAMARVGSPPVHSTHPSEAWSTREAVLISPRPSPA